jgi:hypothetical protein
VVADTVWAKTGVVPKRKANKAIDNIVVFFIITPPFLHKKAARLGAALVFIK